MHINAPSEFYMQLLHNDPGNMAKTFPLLQIVSFNAYFQQIKQNVVSIWNGTNRHMKAISVYLSNVHSCITAQWLG